MKLHIYIPVIAVYMINIRKDGYLYIIKNFRLINQYYQNNGETPHGKPKKIIENLNNGGNFCLIPFKYVRSIRKIKI